MNIFFSDENEGIQKNTLDISEGIRSTSEQKVINVITKDTNRKIRKTEFVYICGSKSGSSNSAVNTGEV